MNKGKATFENTQKSSTKYSQGNQRGSSAQQKMQIFRRAVKDSFRFISISCEAGSSPDTVFPLLILSSSSVHCLTSSYFSSSHGLPSTILTSRNHHLRLALTIHSLRSSVRTRHLAPWSTKRLSSGRAGSACTGSRMSLEATCTPAFIETLTAGLSEFCAPL
jgi:hypothetical protein